MPLYDIEPGANPFGALPFPSPCRVIDAAGKQVPYAVRCDTDTGRVERYDVTADPAGGPWVWATDLRGRPVVVRETRPAPLTIEPIAPGEPYLKPEPDAVVDADAR